MPGLKATQLDGYGDDVIVTECIAQGTSGRIVYSVFANEEDARSDQSDDLVVAVLSGELLTQEQREIAAGNSKALGKSS